MSAKSKVIPMVRVNQWMQSWENCEWSEHLPEPDGYFYVASISLATLRRLSGVNTRNLKDRIDQRVGGGYQRAHQPTRSRSIARYIQFGYPLSGQASLDIQKYKHLIHPGWLPTAILVNVIGDQETRRRGGKERTVADEYRVKVLESNNNFYLEIPNLADSPSFSLPDKSLEPIEVIDGQHRLFAVDELLNDNDIENYEVPVVVFNGLSPSWQAYLFWVINVEPKKINPSLAYDLYPELRNQSWLQAGEGIRVYQEHRAQELTEVLWRHDSSPWKNRIELHGNRVPGHVSNAAFIRSLMSSFVRNWGRENKIGGLFGSIQSGKIERVLPWKRGQQAAFLISCWQHIVTAIESSDAQWVRALSKSITDEGMHPAFAGPHTLLGTDQGVRAVLVVANSIHQVAYAELLLEEWEVEEVSDEPDNDEVSQALWSFQQLEKPNSFMREAAFTLINHQDWRTSSAPGLSPEQKNEQSIYRGSSGYAQLQEKCFAALSNSSDKLLVKSAESAAGMLNR